MVLSGQLSFTRPTAVLWVAVDVLCDDVQVLGLLISVLCSADPDADTAPIVPTVLLHPVVDVARVLAPVPPFA